MIHGPQRPLAVGALALALSACTGGNAPGGGASGDARPDRAWTDAARVEAIASTLQACSYEGKPTQVEAGQLNGQAPADCRSMVDQIMGYTGLPANFVVTAGPVPNALAVILLDKQKIPQRVIAFNPNFIDATQRMTGGGQWGPASIMAHEIGHHLSGHTITAGGSRPGLELEADKFSGYVLYKMGAPLAEATKAIDALGSETEQATHPAKSRRIAAIAQGWQEACRQDGGDCAAGTAPVASNTTTRTPPAVPAPPAAPGVPATPSPSPSVPTAPTRVATLPSTAPDAIPFKYGRFVVDETGKLDAGKLRAFDQTLRTLATDKGVEIAVLFVNDLRGMSPDDYAWAMMRQLRVGKLDLGNGGVFVVAPATGQVGTAYAPGVAKKLEFFDARKRFGIWLGDRGWERGCGAPEAPSNCVAYTGNLLDVVGSQLRYLDTAWTIRFNRIEDAVAHTKAQEDERRAAREAGRTPPETNDFASGSLTRFTATVTDVAPRPGPAQPQSAEDMRVNPRIVADGRWKAVLVKTDTGRETTLYMQPQTASLMPSGKLQVGKQYTFVGEVQSTGRFHTDQGVIQLNPSAWLFSYEAL